MSRIRYEYPFTCPNCKIRVSISTPNNKCVRCGNDITIAARMANEGWTALMILLLLAAGVLVILTRIF
jgi:uncharacterized paraquat-inducible protein A